MIARPTGQANALARRPASRCRVIAQGVRENPTVRRVLAQILFYLFPKTLRVGTRSPGTDEETKAPRGEGMSKVKPEPCPAHTVFSRGRLP